MPFWQVIALFLGTWYNFKVYFNSELLQLIDPILYLLCFIIEITGFEWTLLSALQLVVGSSLLYFVVYFLMTLPSTLYS